MQVRRILHVITTINRGGAENHLAALVQGQREQGFDVAVAYLKGDGYWAKEFERLGVRVTHLGLRWYGDPRPWLQLRRVIRDFEPEIVHAHMPPAELYVRLALLGNQHATMIVSKHNDEPFFRGPGQRLVGRWVIARADRVIAISDAVRAYTIGPALGCNTSRTVAVHYGIDPSPYECPDAALSGRERVRAEWGIDEDIYCIGTVARLVPQKAIHVLLEGYRIYRQLAEVPSRLVIVGDGPLQSTLQKQAAHLGIAEYLTWVGRREDISAVMNAFDVFALTSRYEGFGLVLLEAMSAARPVVATAVSAIPEIVRDGETGRLVASGDAEGIADALKVFEQTTHRAQAGLAGRLRAKSSFSIAKMVTETMQVYEQARSSRQTEQAVC